MSEEINYLDLIILRKVDAESTIEKFGTQINTSYFETANLLGTMKIKGLIDIQTSIGGQSPIVITGDGRDLLSDAVRKAAEAPDTLDQAILHAMAGGAADLPAVQEAINIRSKDLAFHLHKLKSSDLIDYEVRSAKVRLFLTEKGFNQTGGVRSSLSPAGQKSASAPASTGLSSSSAKSPMTKSAASGASAPISLDSEINDILNFGGWNKPKPAAGSAKPAPIASPSASAPKPTPGAPAPSVNFPKPAPLPSDLPPPDSTGPVKLDRTAMLLSKLEYYVRAYAFYAILVLLLLALVAYAVFFAAGPHKGA